MTQNVKETMQEDKTFTAENIPGGVVKAISAYTAREKGRYALNCVHVSGNRMAAADGGTLAEVTLPQSLGPDGLYKVQKPSVRKRSIVQLIRQNGTLKAVEKEGEGSREETYPAGEGTFPRYQEVIPSEKSGVSVLASVSYLKQAINLLECADYEVARIMLPGKTGTPFRIDGVDKQDGITRGSHDIRVTVVISPVLSEEELKSQRK